MEDLQPKIGSNVWKVEVFWRLGKPPHVEMHNCGIVTQVTSKGIHLQPAIKSGPKMLRHKNFFPPFVSQNLAAIGQRVFVFYAPSLQEARRRRKRFLFELLLLSKQANKTTSEALSGRGEREWD